LRKPEPSLHVLLADDQEELRQLTAYLLKKDGHRVTAVPNGREALIALSKRRFDVVLLDEQMPEMSGEEAVRAIRANEQVKGRRQAVLALTGNTAEEDRQRLLAAGMDGCLGKPFRGEELRRKLSELSGVTVRPAGPPSTSTQREVLLRRVGGNARLLRQIVRTFRKDAPRKIAEMKRALHRKDGIALATAAHALKGSASLFGAEKATLGAQQLQEMGRKGEVEHAVTLLTELEEAVAQLREELRGYDAPGTRKAKPQKSGRSRFQGNKPK